MLLQFFICQIDTELLKAKKKSGHVRILDIYDNGHAYLHDFNDSFN